MLLSDHLAVSRAQGSQPNFYVNGVLDSGSVTGGMTTGSMTIPSGDRQLGYTFNGAGVANTMGRMHLYSVALTSDEINVNYGFTKERFGH